MYLLLVRRDSPRSMTLRVNYGVITPLPINSPAGIWAGRIRTYACQDQNLVPYRLATAQIPAGFCIKNNLFVPVTVDMVRGHLATEH
jgi:hypothetical protein